MTLILLGTLMLAPVDAAPSAAPSAAAQRIINADSIVWTGIDYGSVQMIGTYGFEDPAAIFPGYLVKWNGLFINEMIQPLSNSLRRTIRVDLTPVSERNNDATSDQRVLDVGYTREPSLTTGQIQKIVKGYKVKYSNGIGLVYIMEYMLKDAAVACMYVTFYDLSTLDVLHVERTCQPPAGFGFRNYWFGPIKETTYSLRINSKGVRIQ